MPDPERNPPPDRQPVVLIPVTADDVARRKWRILLTLAAVILALLGAAGYMYKRYLDPLRAQESFDAGTRLYKIARYSPAILSFDRAIALKPDLIDAYLLRGKSYVGNAEPDRAIQDFSKVIELRPADGSAWIDRGAAYLELNNFQAAIADASRAISLNPKQSAAYNLRGSAIRKMGDPRKAIADFDRAVALDPSADNYYQRGATYQVMGEHRLAIADFDQVIEIIPDLGNAFFSRAQSRRAVGDLTGAEQDHRAARVLDGK